MKEIDTVQQLLNESYAEWRVNPTVDRDDPTAKFVADLAQLVIALAAIQRGQSRAAGRSSSHNLAVITEDADGCGYNARCECGTGFNTYTERGARGAHAMHQCDKATPPACCGGGPQWGHAWGCPKCPD